ncbi:E3 ubiquitin-ligase FANCL [Micractinium conductrix]|uniref:E3 ubiquitin-ligase FANCL n=1 Tax=Micractinium conductrix TaxID=554055 RepID=A0A2P6V2I1_9CHLO|nr:E3 ubiquitin-ligase FANCL [Micractinium conductrix]|eukprot:PSC68290.1 E3 ubiquitin-ligase FANCL [Micractinium conductrix]
MQATLAGPLAAVAPLLLPCDAIGSTYEGYVLSNAQRAAGLPASLWLRISGLCVGAASLAGARLEVGPELAALLGGGGGGGHGSVSLAQRLAESPSLAAFCVELQNMVDQLSLESAATPAAPSATRPAAFYSGLRGELEALGWQRVAALSPDLSAVTLAAVDAAGRRHELRLSLPPGYPAAQPTPAADLPAPLELRWGAGASLATCLAQFEAALAQHQPLWDSLDDLDAHAWVIEPSAPSRGALHRRIALGSHVSLALTLDPAAPGALPNDCRFMGSDRAVAPLRQRLHDNRGLWQEGRPLRGNLEAVLQLALPQRQGEDAEEASADCAICYAYRLLPAEGGAAEDGEAPDVNCDNAACGKPFHRRCLVEWLNSDQTTRQSFNTLFGACPYCSAPITVKAG